MIEKEPPSSTAGRKCIFCDLSPSEWSKEHVLSSWAGCREAIPKHDQRVCKICNDRFGGGPEAHLYRQMLLLTELFDLPEGAQERRGRVWKADVRGESRQMLVNRETGMASPVAPVVRIEVLPDGSREVFLTGTEAQARKCEGDCRRKGGPLILSQEQPPQEGILLRADLDFKELAQGHSLTAIGKFAACYALWATGRTGLAKAFARQAFDALEGRVDPSSFAGYVGDMALLNRLDPAPLHHTCLLASTNRPGRYVVIIVMFGIIPYYVLSPQVATNFVYHVCHRFMVDGHPSASENHLIVGQPVLDFLGTAVTSDRERCARALQIAENATARMRSICAMRQPRMQVQRIGGQSTGLTVREVDQSRGSAD